MKKNISMVIVLGVLIGAGLYVALGGSGAASSQTNFKARVGQPTPSFTITTTDGTTISSDALRGKVVVLTSSAQWCATCQEEAREFVPVYQKYKDKPMVFITIDIDPRDSVASIEAFKKTYQTPWAYADAQGGADIIRQYGMNRFEMTFIIDQKGVLRYSGDVLTRSDILEAEIETLL